ncbi:MAG TPA: hypothetical protein PLS83_03460 [Methanothrix soehngenii]|nr:hypothetical protein [Methanothrix soehngenii]
MKTKLPTISALLLVLGLCVITQAALSTSDSDQEWVNIVIVSAAFLSQDMQDMSVAADAFDTDALANASSSLYGHSIAAKQLSVNCTVSSDYSTSKREFELALDDFANAGLYGYIGATEMDADSLELASDYMTSGSNHLTTATDALPDE